MNQPDPFVPPFRLGPWLVRSDLNRLEGPEGPVQIEPRVMKVLLCLAENPGTVLTRNQLLDLVWSDTVVGEEILTRAISELRRVFGDNARHPLYIETIRNHGYRLIAEIAPVGPDEDPPPPEESTAPVDPAQPVRSRTPWMPLGLVALVVLAMVIWRPWAGRPAGQERAPLTDRAVPLTSYPGREWHPALSPDGTRVAFIRRLPDAGHSDLFIKQRNSETALALTDGPGWTAWPAWSPDGQSLAFVKDEGKGPTLCTVPSLGGAVRRLLTVDALVDGLDWSPDGEDLVYSALDTAAGEYRLFHLDLADLTVAVHAPADPGHAGDFQPRFSPDGKDLAWMSMDQDGACYVFVGPREGSEAWPVTAGLTGIQGLAWSADGRSLVYAASPGGTFGLWRVAVDRASGVLPVPEALPVVGDLAWNPTIARQSGDLAYEQVRVDQDLWQVRVLAEEPWQVATTPFLQSTRWEYEAAVSPDGTQVALVSARSGRPEIWLTDRQGNHLRQVTALQADALANLRFSPEGTRLAFNVVEGGRQRIWTVGTSGGPPRAFSQGERQEILADWTPDGEGLAFSAQLAGTWQIFRRNLEGGEQEVLTTGGGVAARFSRDGARIFHVRPGQAGIWELDLAEADARPRLVVPELAGGDRLNWAVADRGIFWVLRSGASTLLGRHDLATGHSAFLTDLPGFAGQGLAVSPAGDAVFFARTGEMAGDLMIFDRD